MNFTGRYTADRITLKYQWFHPGNISAHGSYRADNHSIDLPDLEALAIGGNVTSHVRVNLPKLDFRADSKVRGMDLHQALAAEDNSSLPINPLHWGSRMDAEATTTWIADFKHVDSRGVMLWTPPDTPAPGQIPTAANFEFHYDMDRKQVELAPGEIITPTSLVVFRGVLSMIDSSLDVTVDTQDLIVWDDFINRLRGPDAERQVIGGQFHWEGRLTGRLDAPTFTGHVKGTQARYGTLFWDELEGELTYSPNQLHFYRARARRGKSSADLELSLALDNWGFDPDSEWTFDLNLVGADTDDLQKMLGTSYPAHGILTGQFHGKGTRAAPEYSGLFDLSDATAGSWRFDRARGQLSMRPGAKFEFPTPRSACLHMRRVRPQACLREISTTTRIRQATFHSTSRAPRFRLRRSTKSKPARLPVGGRLNLQARGQGPLRAPEMHATLRLIDLKTGQ